MAFPTYSNDRDWLDAIIQTAFPDGTPFAGKTVKTFLGDKQSTLSLDSFLTQQSSVNNIALMRGLQSFDELGRHEDESRANKMYSVFIRIPNGVEMEDVIDQLRTTMLDNGNFIVNGRARFGRIKSGSSLRDSSFDAFEINVLVT